MYLIFTLFRFWSSWNIQSGAEELRPLGNWPWQDTGHVLYSALDNFTKDNSNKRLKTIWLEDSVLQCSVWTKTKKGQRKWGLSRRAKAPRQNRTPGQKRGQERRHWQMSWKNKGALAEELRPLGNCPRQNAGQCPVFSHEQFHKEQKRRFSFGIELIVHSYTKKI